MEMTSRESLPASTLKTRVLSSVKIKVKMENEKMAKNDEMEFFLKDQCSSDKQSFSIKK